MHTITKIIITSLCIAVLNFDKIKYSRLILGSEIRFNIIILCLVFILKMYLYETYELRI